MLPLALIGLVAGLWLTRRGGRTDLGRAGYVLWGGWALVHPRRVQRGTGDLPPVLHGGPGPARWPRWPGPARWPCGGSAGPRRWWAWVLPAAVLATALLAADLLGRTPGYDPGLATAVVIGGLLAALAIGLHLFGAVGRRWFATAAGCLAVAVVLAGPAAYALTTLGQSPSGGDPEAGPAISGAGVGFGPTGGRAFGGPGAAAAGGVPAGGGQSNAASGLDRYLVAHRDGATWLVAANGSMTAAPIELATGEPVMSMGGFNGSDPWPTVAAFKKLVAEGKIRYVLVGTGGGAPGGGGSGPGAGGLGPRGVGTAGSAPAGSAPAGSAPADRVRGTGAVPPGAGGAGAGGSLPGLGGSGPPGALGRTGTGPGGTTGAGGPGGSATVSAVDQWVTAHGTKVPSSAYGTNSGGTLYEVTPASVG